FLIVFFFSSRRRHTRWPRDWSSDVCSSDLDVMLENFRPGLMTKLHLDYATLSKKFPRLIYVSHKGFLPGPYENRLALDEVVQMRSEERRVWKECRTRWSPTHSRKQKAMNRR